MVQTIGINKKYLLGLLSLFVLSSSCFGQVIDKNRNRVHFKVSKVEPAKDSIKEAKVKSVIESHVGHNIESYSIAQKDELLIGTKMHSFISALHYSYAQHRTISISPDMIWLMILQSVSEHINQNYDSLRTQIVNFDGKKEIVIQRDDFIKGNENNKWHEAIPTFSDSIEKFVTKDFYGLCDKDFSTTSYNEKIAFQVTLMNAVDNYFSFWTGTSCGIPSIILEGTAKDWKWIYNNVDKFNAFGLEHWINELKPILFQFVRARKGDVDKAFWQSIYKIHEDCVDIYVSGWIMNFFLFTYNPEGKLIPNKNIMSNYYFCDMAFNKIPTGISKANFKWYYHPENILLSDTFNMEFCAGFIGISQDVEHNTIRPNILWYVKDSLASTLETSNVSSVESLKVDCYDWYVKGFEVIEDKPIFFPELSKSYEEGEKNLQKYLQKEVSQLKGRDKFTGQMLIGFRILKDGSINNIEIIKSDIPNLNEMLRNIVENIPKCTPAKQRGKAVGMDYMIPITLKKN